MKPILMLLLAAALAAITLGAGCSGHQRYHAAELPDPAKFNAHFGDLDDSGDGQLTRAEFERHFPGSHDSVFNALDLDADGVVDHEEWHRFKTAHGLKHGG